MFGVVGQQCCVRLHKAYVKPVAISFFQIQNRVYCKLTISWNLNWVSGRRKKGRGRKIPVPFSPPHVPPPTPVTQAEAPCKRTQRCWPSSPKIAGYFILRQFAHPVGCCYVLLGVVVQSLKPVKLLATYKRTQQLPAVPTMLGVVASVCT